MKVNLPPVASDLLLAPEAELEVQRALRLGEEQNFTGLAQFTDQVHASDRRARRVPTPQPALFCSMS